MKVDYVTHSGSDLLVANAARVSFAKHKDELDESDAKLIAYLARHRHWTPFSHPQLTLRVKAPIFVARQLFKHKVGLTENEVSRRYVDDDPEFYAPDVWRGRPTGGAKQGSSGVVVQLAHKDWEEDLWGDVDVGFDISHHVDAYNHSCQQFYKTLLASGVAPEQARMVLPQSMYTEWYWTGSLAAYSRIYALRSDPHAQQETQEVAKMIDAIVRPLFPISWEALCGTST